MQAYKNKFDIYELYEASVQNVITDLNFGTRVFKKHNTKTPTTIREDFCGTAKLAIDWVLKDKKNKSVAIDLNESVLNWTQKYSLSKLTNGEQKRIKLINQNVLDYRNSFVDIAYALNFSYCYFKERETLKNYFKNINKSLHKNGIFILDIYGGTESIIAKQDAPRIIPGFTSIKKIKIPDFEYIWDQKKYNPINHHTSCSIHFKIPGVGLIKNAFTYNWRLWTIPEIIDLMKDVGFKKTSVYLHDFNNDGESDEIFRIRKTYENTEGWIAYVVGIK